MLLHLLACLLTATAAAAQAIDVERARHDGKLATQSSSRHLTQAAPSCKNCKQAHKACNIGPNGKGQCLPCNKVGRSCCADSTCSKNLVCDSSNKCADETVPAPPTAEYVVTQCEPGSITVESTTIDADLPVVGNIFQNLAALPTSAADLCTDCGQFGAVVTGVGAPGPCASSADPCVSVQLQTRPARLSEMYEPGLLAAAGLSDSAEVTALELLGCADGDASATTSARRRLAGISFGAGRSLLQVAPPSTCTKAAWNAVDGDGRCVYTDCFAGDKDPQDCFGCSGFNCDNGCGPEPNSIKNWFLNNIIPESGSIGGGDIFDFSAACCNHDYCYASTAFDQAECDTALLNQARASCAPDESDIAIIRWILKGQTVSKKFLCERAAQLYYFAVDAAGKEPKADGEKLTEAWEQSPACAAPCPTTQTSGGKGGTTLRIDMKGRTGPFDIQYNMYSIPDALKVTYGSTGNGDVLFATPGLVSGSRFVTVDMPDDGVSSIVTVEVDAPRDGTAWDIFVGCPANEPGRAR